MLGAQNVAQMPDDWLSGQLAGQGASDERLLRVGIYEVSITREPGEMPHDTAERPQ